MCGSMISFTFESTFGRYLYSYDMKNMQRPTEGESQRARGGKAWRGGEGGTGRGRGGEGKRSEAIRGDLRARSHDG